MRARTSSLTLTQQPVRGRAGRHLGNQPLVKDVGLRQVVFEICRARQHDSLYVHLQSQGAAGWHIPAAATSRPGIVQSGWSRACLVVRYEHLCRGLCHLAHVVVPLLQPQPCKPQRRLTTAAVLLGKVDRELVQDLARVAGERAEERPVTVHHDEAKLVVRLEQLLQRLGGATTRLASPWAKAAQGQVGVNWRKHRGGGAWWRSVSQGGGQRWESPRCETCCRTSTGTC